MTILERVRCMLLGVGMLKSLHGEVVITIAYMINIWLSTRICFNTRIWRFSKL